MSSISHKKPGLLRFSAYFQFFMALIFASVSSNLSSAALWVVVLYWLWCGLLVALGVGLLKRQRWARNISVAVFSLFVLSGLLNLSKQDKVPDSATASYRVGYSIGRVLPFMGSALGLYALLFNRSVKRYFNGKTGENSDEISLESIAQNVGIHNDSER